MIGGAALQSWNASVPAQLAVLAAALSYAFAGVFGRRFKAMGIRAARDGRRTGHRFERHSAALAPCMVDRPWTLPAPSAGAIVSLIGAWRWCRRPSPISCSSACWRGPARRMSGLVTFLIPVSAILLGILLRTRPWSPAHRRHGADRRRARSSSTAGSVTALRAARQREAGGVARNWLNIMSGALVLWRDGTSRPIQTSVALALAEVHDRLLAPGRAFSSRAAMRATSALNSVTYMERRAAKGWPSTARSKVDLQAQPLLGEVLDRRRSPVPPAGEGQREGHGLGVEGHVLQVHHRPARPCPPDRPGTRSHRRSIRDGRAAAGGCANSRRPDRGPAPRRRGPSGASGSASCGCRFSTRSPTRTVTSLGRQKWL